MKKIVYSLLLTTAFCFAETYDEEPPYSADCLILKDENSIICKYEHERLEEDVDVTVEWINPEGEISRKRAMVIQAGYGSIYDFRFIEGRMKGKWTFKVKEGDILTETTFVVE